MARSTSNLVPHALHDALVQPKKWLSSYGEFIAKNASAVSQIESGLRSLTYIIPGRFGESELASESLHSGVQLLSLYHDSLLARAAAALPLARKPLPSPHARYTKFWTKRSPLYRRLALLLQMIQYTELLWEMAARRRGERMRWRVVVLLECLKAICRLLLLRLTNSRPLLTPPLPGREIDPSKLEESTSASTSGSADGEEAEGEGEEGSRERRSSSASAATSADGAAWIMPRTGLSLPTLPSQDISSYLLSHVVTADDIKPPAQLLHRLTTSTGTLAEVMYILRPVVYAIAMQHWAFGPENKGNWRPWLLGLSVEWGARQLAKRDLERRVAGGWRGMTGLEREEMSKRGWALAWWGMRGAFYENITKSWIHSVSSSLNSKPVLSMIGGIIEDYEFLWDQYYFPTATL